PFTPDSAFDRAQPPHFPDITTLTNKGTSSLSITALARFEFEAGKGNDGTKILMVEWEDDHQSRSRASGEGGGSWHVFWDGKTTVLPADEQTSENTRRFYFLLPPNVTIPPVVTLSFEPANQSAHKTDEATTTTTTNAIQLNPLPAIFPPELGVTGRSAGKKGVLHTIWAKKRLRVLEKEIREECLKNAEGIALHMALQEKEWIESNFGVTSRSHSSTAVYPTGPVTPVSPVSPVSGRRLADKLMGLKLQTGEKDLASRSDSPAAHLLSPQSPDVAVSSFSSFRPIPQSQLQPQKLQTAAAPATSTAVWASDVSIVAQYPPESLQRAQIASGSGFASMAPPPTESPESSDDLFAKALSPRSPDLPQSPFSFAP
ncbi:hypothetical protein ASPZODRAFT_49032, partial [Penicilliopsis zonata CBS 506.65]